jgi:UDP-N-acetylglucosamine 2-epimerase (non-hydrolysing)
MPEELNRVVTDHISNLLLCPTQTATDNLKKEGITDGVYLVGDVMVDALKHNAEIARKKSQIIKNLGLKKGDYYVATVHRPGIPTTQRILLQLLRHSVNQAKLLSFLFIPAQKNIFANMDYGIHYLKISGSLTHSAISICLTL